MVLYTSQALPPTIRRRTSPVRPPKSSRRSTSCSRTHGTDKTRLLQAQIWVNDIRDRDAMNKVWVEWLPEGPPRSAPASRPRWADPRLLVEIMVTACK